MANYHIAQNPEFRQTMRKLETDDPAHADLFNESFRILLENDNKIWNDMQGMAAITREEIDALDGQSGGGGSGSITGSEITTEDIDNII